MHSSSSGYSLVVPNQPSITLSCAQHSNMPKIAYPSEFHNKDYCVEYARSGKSHCHYCHDMIPKSSVRIARIVPAATFEGDIEVWYHPKCMFADTWQHPIYVDQVDGIDDLFEDDQDKVTSLIKQFGADDHFESDLHGGFITEYARSGVSECRGCYEPIDKDDIRVGILVHPPIESPFQSVVPEWHHLFCFFNRPDFADLSLEAVSQFAGYRLMDAADLRIIDDLIRMKEAGEKIPGSKKVLRAWAMKAKGEIVPKRSLKRSRGM